MMSVIIALAAFDGAEAHALAAAPVIGTVVAKGAFRLDHATVTGNATLFEGATVETATASSRMELSSGARVNLSVESRAKFYGDHMVLERGLGEMEKASTFRLEAQGLTFQPETGSASARVALSGGARVELAVLTGSFRILNAKGVLVANAGAGRSLEFEPQSSQTQSPGLTKMTGTLRLASGHYLLTDETTNVTVELAGTGLSRDAGYRVEITGAEDPTATPVTDASHYIRVTTVKRLGNAKDTGAGAAAAGKGGAAAGGGSTAGGIHMSATTIAIIGGVAVAATVGGLAAAGKLPGQGTTSTISR
jgi:hypothetical protein